LNWLFQGAQVEDVLLALELNSSGDVLEMRDVCSKVNTMLENAVDADGGTIVGDVVSSLGDKRRMSTLLEKVVTQVGTTPPPWPRADDLI